MIPMNSNAQSSRKFKKELQHYLHRNNGFVKQLFLGRPGSGKTLLCTMLFLQAVPKGLNCSITCLSGERAQLEQIYKKCSSSVTLMPSQRIT